LALVWDPCPPQVNFLGPRCWSQWAGHPLQPRQLQQSSRVRLLPVHDRRASADCCVPNPVHPISAECLVCRRQPDHGRRIGKRKSSVSAVRNKKFKRMRLEEGDHAQIHAAAAFAVWSPMVERMIGALGGNTEVEEQTANALGRIADSLEDLISNFTEADE